MRSNNIEDLQLTCDLLINKSIIIYGASKTGKTTLILYILKMLKKKIPNILVVSTSESQNGNFNCVVPEMCIRASFDTVDIYSMLKGVWERQKFVSTINKKTENITYLKDIITKLESEKQKQIKEKEAKLTTIYESGKKTLEAQLDTKSNLLNFIIKSNPSNNNSEIKNALQKLTTSYEKSLKKIYHSSIKEYIDNLEINTDEKHQLILSGINPHLLLIFDDCSDCFSDKNIQQILQQFFYRGRHVNITIIISAQDDKNIPSNLRKNAFYSIFCSCVSANSFFDKQSNGFSKEEKIYFPSICRSIMMDTGDLSQKALFVREESKIYRIKSQLTDKFKMGCKKWWDFTNLENNDEIKSNKYYTMLVQTLKDKQREIP